MLQPSKYYNAFRSGFSFIASSLVHHPVVYGMPPALGIELTNHCNLKCPECPSGAGTMKRERGFMDPGMFRKLMYELRAYLFNANLYFQGEPMMHPAFFDFLDYGGEVPFTVSTNGHFLSPENCRKLVQSRLKKLIISLDGLDQETYSVYRTNGNVDRVRAGIIALTEAVRNEGSSLKVEVQILVNKYNESKVAGIKEFVKGAGAIPVLKSMQIYEPTSFSDWMPSNERFRRYYIENGGVRIKSRLPGRCARLWFNPVVTWDGRVVPCCFDKDAGHVMGNLSDQSFREIWHGEKFREFRKMVLTGREKILICRNCTSGLSGVIT